MTRCVGSCVRSRPFRGPATALESSAEVVLVGTLIALQHRLIVLGMDERTTTVFPNRSEANLVTFQLGVSIGFRAGGGDGD